MSKNHYEIEIKSLLGNKENADGLVAKMQSDPTFQELGGHKQLNHYFQDGNLEKLYQNMEPYLDDEQKAKFEDIAERAKTFSVRTRWADGKVLLVIKASVDDTTSSNGTARIEFEAQTPNLTIEQLDQIILDSGFSYQAKWSRERQEFKFRNASVSIDKNAGYGYLAEFEVPVEHEELVDETKAYIRAMMEELEILELAQDRLERMFDHYNHNWQDYYGTDKTFIIE